MLDAVVSSKYNRKKIAWSIVKYAILIAVVLIVVIPILGILFGSLKGYNEFRDTSVIAFPRQLYFGNYVKAFVEGKMLIGFGNTALILAASLVLAIATGTMTAYALDRFDFKGKVIIKNLFLLAALIPSITIQVMTYRVAIAFRLVDLRLAPILLFGGTDIITVYIFLQFFKNISKSIDESAKIDGANGYIIFFRIILPLLMPAIATVLIIKFVGIYNEFYIPLIYIPDVHMVSTALYNFNTVFGTDWEVICAGQIIVIIPMLVIFLTLQKYIYSGLTSGSIKE